MSSERSMSAQKVSESSQTTIKWVAIWPHGTPAVRKNVMTVPLSHMKRFKAPENASDYENGRPYSYKPPSAEHSKFVHVLALAGKNTCFTSLVVPLSRFVCAPY